MTELLAPNGKKSNLTLEQWHLVRTLAFKQWFGDWENLILSKLNDSGIDEVSLKRLEDGVSKVVDENGEPLVCRHYSQKPKRFNEFTKQKANDTRNFMSYAKEGFYFSTTDKDSMQKVWNRSKRGFLYEVFLNVKNILDLGDYNAYDFKTKKAVNWKDFTFEMLEKYVTKGRQGSFDDYTEYNENVDAFWIDEINEDAKAKIFKLGYDAIWGDKDKYADSVSDEFFGTDQIVVFESNQIKLADGSNTTFDGSNLDIRFGEGGQVQDLISQGVVELKMFDTKPEHAKEYGFDVKNPLYIQSICIQKNERLKGIGKKVFQYIDEYAIKNGHDLIFGHITQKANFTKDKRETDLCDIDLIKEFLIKSGYKTIEGNNDFHKVIKINPDIRFEKGGLVSGNVYSGKEIRKIVSNYGSQEGTNMPEFASDYISLNDKYTLQSVSVEKLIKKDNDLKEFITDEYDPNANIPYSPIKEPILLGNGIYQQWKENVVLDGYHRVLQALYNKDEKILAFVKLNSADKITRFEKGGDVGYIGNNYLKKKYNHLKKENTTFEDLPTIYIRVGLPRKTGDKYQPSRNYLLGTLEEGVSVFTAKYSPNSNFVFVDLENYKYFLTETYEAFVYGFPLKDGEMSDEKYIMYLLEGSPLMWGKKGAQNYVYQEGSDGERLLDTKTITVIGELNPEKIIKYSSDYDEDVIDKETFSGIELQQYPKYADGGRTIAQTPSLKKDQIYGSDKNKQGSSKSLKSAKQIKFDEQTLLSIANKVKQHNTKHPDKKITIDSAKAVVRRGMGAYSTSHRPTIKNGKPNNRIAWGLARLNAFTYKIINGKSKSGKYTQDDDLIKELNYMVKSYKDGGNVPKSNKMFHLPLELVVYVPSTKDVNKTISKQEMKERVDEVKNYLGVAFGGYSSIKIEGGYVANNGELVSENITKVVSFASKDDYEKNKNELVNQMTNWSQKWGQEAIGFEFEGDLYYVPEKLKKGGEITNTKNGETKIAKSGIHEGWGFKDTFKVLLKGAKSNIIKTFKELNLLFPDYDKEVIKGETIEIYIEENSFNKVKKIASYNDLTILYEDGGQIDYSTGWNQDYESDPLVIGKKKAKELATRGVLAYATRGQSELSRAANKGQDNENGQEQNEMFSQLAKSGALGKMEHGGEVHYSMGGQSMNNRIEKAFKEISEKNPPITNFLKRGGTTLKQENKISKVMREFKEGKLHSGSKKGPVVKDREQAIAIALSEANVKRKRN